MKSYDVLVIGGGHAGIEASVAAAKMGCKTALATMEKQGIGRLSCNPAIGGTAKGHLVREIDALGGVMGEIADATGIQFRMLNRSKGPAVWSPRSQNDRTLYNNKAVEVVENTQNLDIVDYSIVEIIQEAGVVTGVKTSDGEFISAKAVVLCSGTFLNGLMHVGVESIKGGRFGEQPAVGITASLVAMGFESGRLKTGTPPRLRKSSIDFSSLEEQAGDENPQPFSHRTPLENFPFQPQVSCHITYTSEEVHKILEKGFDLSPMFTGRIQGVGPRYCPSIEDKIVRFAERTSHQLFLEPEGLESDLIYLAGFSSSLPAEIQLEAMRKIKGLEEVDMVRAGYAVEYDFFPPHQVDLTLETKLVKGLYFAGQVNGTSGYEEAAAQGLIAGINAALKIKGEEELVLRRSDAYIGVLIDDLVNKTTDEPYRIFTSRAEHRLLLRQDNADIRLSHLGKRIGLIGDNEYAQVMEKQRKVEEGKRYCEQTKLPIAVINPLLEEAGSQALQTPETLSKLSKRPEITLRQLLDKVPDQESVPEYFSNQEILDKVEIDLKYEGYIKRQQDQVEKMERYEEIRIPFNIDFSSIKQLSTEARENLTKHRPRSVGQALRIAAITPSDISILLVYLKK